MKESGGAKVFLVRPVELSVATRPIPMTVKRTNVEIDALLEGARPWLYRLALAIVAEPNLAEDVAQEALIRANRSRRQLASATDPKAWLRRVLVRRAMTALKYRKVDPLTEDLTAPDQFGSLEVRETLAQLAPEDRILLALAHFEQLSYAEIAEYLEVPEGTVASRLHSARAAFKEAWRR